MRRKPFSAKSSAAAPQRRTILASRQRLTRLVQDSVRAKQLSIKFVELNVRTSDSCKPSRVIVSVSSRPSSRLRAALGLIESSHFTQARNSFKASSGVLLAQALRKRHAACE